MSASQTQRAALMAFVYNGLNGDPASPFPDERIRWADEGHAPPNATYCTIDYQGSEAVGGPSEVQSTGTTHGNHRTMVRDLHEVTVSITVYAKLDESAPDHRHRADVILDGLHARVFAPWVNQGLRDAGMPPIRRGQVRDLTRFHRGSQWQTVAEMPITFARTTVIYDAPGTIDEVAGTGTTNPATGSSITFDAQE